MSAHHLSEPDSTSTIHTEREQEPVVATQEQKDKKVAAAAKKVEIVGRKIVKATATKEKAEKALAALAIAKRIADANLKHAEATPVNGEFEQEAEAEVAAEDNEPAFI